MSSILLRRRSSLNTSTFSKLLCNSHSLRFMGGGPRTFPGGLNKWQWKRMHEKKAREKEKKLLVQEKQVYESRIRSQIRSKVAGNLNSDNSNFAPMTAQDQVKLLADRFMKEGAEDLWNEDDGPTENPSNRQVARPSIESTKFLPDNSRKTRNLADNAIDLRSFVRERSLAELPENRGASGSSFDRFRRFGNVAFCRHYSVITGKRLNSKSKPKENYRSSSSDDGEGEFIPDGFGIDRGLLKPGASRGGVGREDKRNLRWPRFNIGEAEEEEEPGARALQGRIDPKEVGSRAALGKYDLKPKRRPIKQSEDGDFYSESPSFRDELKLRDLYRKEMGHLEKEESHLSEKRCNIK